MQHNLNLIPPPHPRHTPRMVPPQNTLLRHPPRLPCHIRNTRHPARLVCQIDLENAAREFNFVRDLVAFARVAAEGGGFVAVGGRGPSEDGADAVGVDGSGDLEARGGRLRDAGDDFSG